MKRKSGQQVRKPQGLDKTLPENKTQWFRNPSILIAALSLLASTAVGILSITNARYLARLEKDVYTPSLQYRISQSSYGLVEFEITNQGLASSNNLTINIHWEKLILSDCVLLPPYQDAEPIQPASETYLTYRLASLPIQARITIICATSLVKSNSQSLIKSPFPINSSKVFEDEHEIPGINFPLWASFIPKNGRLVLSPEGKYGLFSEIEITPTSISIDVFSDNSNPAIELGRPPKLWTWIGSLPGFGE